LRLVSFATVFWTVGGVAACFFGGVTIGCRLVEGWARKLGVEELSLLSTFIFLLKACS
jgi:hypothetical protein